MKSLVHSVGFSYNYIMSHLNFQVLNLLPHGISTSNVRKMKFTHLMNVGNLRTLLETLVIWVEAPDGEGSKIKSRYLITIKCKMKGLIWYRAN